MFPFKVIIVFKCLIKPKSENINFVCIWTLSCQCQIVGPRITRIIIENDPRCGHINFPRARNKSTNVRLWLAEMALSLSTVVTGDGRLDLCCFLLFRIFSNELKLFKVRSLLRWFTLSHAAYNGKNVFSIFLRSGQCTPKDTHFWHRPCI